MGLELERSFPIELDDLVPAQQPWSAAAPGEREPSVGDAGRHEHRRPKASLREHAERVLGDVEEAVVEVEADGARRDRSTAEETNSLEDVHDAVTLRGQIVHLLAKAARCHRELVAVVGDAVVEEDP